MKKIRLKHLFTPLSTSSHSTLTLFPLHKLTRSTKNKEKNRNQVKEKAPYKLSSTLLHQIRKKKGPPSLDFIFCSNWLFSFGTGILERVTTSVSIVICKWGCGCDMLVYGMVKRRGVSRTRRWVYMQTSRWDGIKSSITVLVFVLLYWCRIVLAVWSWLWLGLWTELWNGWSRIWPSANVLKESLYSCGSKVGLERDWCWCG